MSSGNYGTYRIVGEEKREEEARQKRLSDLLAENDKLKKRVATLTRQLKAARAKKVR